MCSSNNFKGIFDIDKVWTRQIHVRKNYRVFNYLSNGSKITLIRNNNFTIVLQNRTYCNNPTTLNVALTVSSPVSCPELRQNLRVRSHQLLRQILYLVDWIHIEDSWPSCAYKCLFRINFEETLERGVNFRVSNFLLPLFASHLVFIL